MNTIVAAVIAMNNKKPKKLVEETKNINKTDDDKLKYLAEREKRRQSNLAKSIWG